VSPAGSDASAGSSFSTNDPVSVTALDAFDPTGSDGQVRLYNGVGTVLASATVTTSDPQEGWPIPFYSQPITPVSLAAGETYYIAEDFAPSTTAYLLASGLTTDPEITYGGAVLALGQGQNPTTGFLMGIGNPANLARILTLPSRYPSPAALRSSAWDWPVSR
jgi:hypothetical protein